MSHFLLFYHYFSWLVIPITHCRWDSVKHVLHHQYGLVLVMQCIYTKQKPTHQNIASWFI